jgi:hypothetical protein
VSWTGKGKFGGRHAAASAALIAGVAAIGAGIFLAQDKSAERPDYDVLVAEGDFEIRQYPSLLLAETVVTDARDRKQALERGFRMLADYIFAKSRPGEKIAMTAPVLSDHLAGDDPASSERDAGWRIRFIMPRAYTRHSLPPAPAGIVITDAPSRRLAVVRFAGLASDTMLQEREAGLRLWLERRGEAKAGKVEYAFYDAPFIPGPLRRNEVLIPLG